MKFNLEHELVWVSPLDVMIEKRSMKIDFGFEKVSYQL